MVGPDGRARPRWAAASPLLQDYYDHEWGMPVRNEQGVFERLCLEGFQAGLSWATVLRKRPAFREVFYGFAVDRVAAMGERDVERLLQDPRIIRHRGKIWAAIQNASAAQRLREADGGLAAFVWAFQPERTYQPVDPADIPTQDETSRMLSRELKRRGFRFVGPTTMFALMEAIGMVDTHLLGSHRRGSSGEFNPDGTRSR